MAIPPWVLCPEQLIGRSSSCSMRPHINRQLLEYQRGSTSQMAHALLSRGADNLWEGVLKVIVVSIKEHLASFVSVPNK